MKVAVLLALLGVRDVLASQRDPSGFEDGSDLEYFVTRPDIRAPKYMVSQINPEAVSEGYWFVTPYTSLDEWDLRDRREHVACQTGPMIYDNNGTLIWSGACNYDNRQVFNFKPTTIQGSQHLKFFLPGNRQKDDLPVEERTDSGIIMNSLYQEVDRIMLWSNKTLDRHEFRPQPDGLQALVTTSWKVDRIAHELDQGERSFRETGFQEIDMTNGEALFDWEPIAHGVFANESCDTKGMRKFEDHWDWLHLDSVDKNFNGDYLVSGRHTSTVYKISGKDGSVAWRLGGCAGLSDFEMEDGVEFHWQHQARFRFENETHTVISLFDNGAENEGDRNPDVQKKRSAGKIIMLDHQKHTARIVRRFDRPDGESSDKLGSLQVMGTYVRTSNVLMNWGMQGYISEFDGQNNLVAEAKFLSDRHRSYRAYKYPWVGHPIELPVLKVLPIGHSEDNVASAFYVSWNGATEVASWAFYGGNVLDAPYKLLATVKKHGFETSWVMAGAVKFAYAEALDSKGRVLAKTTAASILPVGNGAFKFRSPLLDNLVTFDGTPIAPKEGSLSLCRTAEPPRSLLSTCFSLLVGALALYGCLGAARKLRDELLRRRKGYKHLAAGDRRRRQREGSGRGRAALLLRAAGARALRHVPLDLAAPLGPEQRQQARAKKADVNVVTPAVGSGHSFDGGGGDGGEKALYDLDWDEFGAGRESPGPG